MLKIGNFKFSSRLILGTGKYSSLSETEEAISISGAELVTVAIRKINFSEKNKKSNYIRIAKLWSFNSIRRT